MDEDTFQSIIKDHCKRRAVKEVSFIYCFFFTFNKADFVKKLHMLNFI